MEKTYDSLSVAVNKLKEEGYSSDLKLKEDRIEETHQHLEIMPSDFEVDAVYRFEGKTNPDDMSILFAISSSKHGLKGLLVDAYGVHGSPVSPEMIEKLRYRNGA